MRALTPWTGTGLKREMDRLFDRFFESPWAELPALGDWTPPLDVAESKDAVTVKAELPGVDAKDVAVSLEGDMLTDRKSTRLNSSHSRASRMPSSA